jgi:hypothetical protein
MAGRGMREKMFNSEERRGTNGMRQKGKSVEREKGRLEGGLPDHGKSPQ